MEFDPKTLLPETIIVSSAGTHFYSIGLSLFQNQSVKRKRYNNPLFIFFVNLQMLIRCMVALNLSENNELMFLIIGEFSRFLKIRIQYSLAVILIILLPLMSQIIHYYNYKNNIKPEYLKPFDMISGLVSPQSIGLTDKEEIYKLVKQSKTLFICCEFLLNRATPLIGFFMNFLTFSLNCSLNQLIIFYIPHCIVSGFTMYAVYSPIFWQLVYYYIICQYLKSKIKTINRKIIELNDKKRMNKKNVVHIL